MRAVVCYPTKYRIHQERFFKRVFEITAERRGTITSSEFDISIEDQRFEPERVSQRAHR